MVHYCTYGYKFRSTKKYCKLYFICKNLTFNWIGFFNDIAVTVEEIKISLVILLK